MNSKKILHAFIQLQTDLRNMFVDGIRTADDDVLHIVSLYLLKEMIKITIIEYILSYTFFFYISHDKVIQKSSTTEV